MDNRKARDTKLICDGISDQLFMGPSFYQNPRLSRWLPPVSVPDVTQTCPVMVH